MTSNGSWWGYGAIIMEAVRIETSERSRRPLSCACGEPLRPSPKGGLFCIWDGSTDAGATQKNFLDVMPN